MEPKELKEYFCRNCGSPKLREEGDIIRCASCGMKFKAEIEHNKLIDEMHTLADKIKAERVAALRQQLYEKTDAKYADSEARKAIVEICRNIRNYLPNDFCARFYEVANCGTTNELAEFIDKICVDNEKYPFIEGMIKFTLKALKKELIAPLGKLIESAYEGKDTSKRKEMFTALEDEVKKLDKGFYDLNVPRDAFILYSHKDLKKVEKLVKELERQKLKCFYAARNLQHGSGAMSSYKEALETAMNRCMCVVFVSSRNSRDPDCQAYYHELKYLRERDENNFPANQKNKEYRDVSSIYKKPRVEYLIEDYESDCSADAAVKEFFHGLDFCGSPKEVADRIFKIKNGEEISDPPPQTNTYTPPQSERPANASSYNSTESSNSDSPSYTSSISSSSYGSYSSYSRRKRRKKISVIVAVTLAVALLIGLGAFLIPNLLNNGDDVHNNENTISTVVNSQYDVSVSPSQGGLPASAILEVEEIEGDASLSEIIAGLPIKQENYHLYDMSLINNGETLDLGKNAVVNMPLPAGISSDKAVVYYISNTAGEKIVSSVVGNKISFTTNHFSIYLIGEAAEASQPDNKTATIIYDANGGNGYMSSQSVTVEKQDELKLCSLTRNGYTFGGWATSPEGSVVYEDEAFFTAVSATETTLYAVWIPHINSLVFNANGGIGFMSSMSLETGESISLPANLFYRTGYTFMGWGEISNGTVKYTDRQSFTMKPQETVTLYAIWSLNSNSVILKANNGTDNEMIISIDNGNTQNLPQNTFTRKGYTFAGWSYTPSGTVEFGDGANYTMGNSSVTLYSVWKPNLNKIVFDSNGGYGVMDYQYVCTNEIADLNPCGFIRDGYTFEGWSTSPTGGIIYADRASYSMGDESSYILYAVWAKDGYRITYHLNNGINNADNPISYDITEAVYFADPAREGYSFGGWYADEELRERITYIPRGSMGNKDVYASWIPNSNRIVFESNDGSGRTNTQEIKSDETVSLKENTFTRLNFVFAGWSTSPDGGVAYADKASFNSGIENSVTLYAVWKPVVYNISYDLQGGSISDNKISYLPTDEAFVLPTPTKIGYIFRGWSGSGIDGMQMTVTVSKGSVGDLSFIANWEAMEYTIGFNANDGGKLVLKTIKVVCGEYVELPVIEQSGATFEGWYIGDMKVESGEWSIAENVVLEARWKTFVLQTIINIAFIVFLVSLVIAGAVFIVLYPLFESKIIEILGSIAAVIAVVSFLAFLVLPRFMDKDNMSIKNGVLKSVTATSEEKIEVPYGVTQIGSDAFSGFFNVDSQNVKSIVLPESVESIEANAFSNCRDLREIYIGSNVKYIGPSAFARSKNLLMIYFNGTEEEWNAIEKYTSTLVNWDSEMNDKCEIIFLK